MSIEQSSSKSISASCVATALDLAVITEPVKHELKLVDEWLNSNLVDNNPFIAELLSQVFKSGGKRIRPILALLSAKATAHDQHQSDRLPIILAVLTELIHTASLVHDDVLDEAGVRRGAQTINRAWNDKLAVLIGDLLFAQASICLSRLMNPEVVGIYGQVLGDLCAGEISQMRQQFVTTLEFDLYIQKSIWKTASLFAAGCQSAAILNGRNPVYVGALKDYGTNLGICFQIIDDLLDVTGDSNVLGKAAGSDLANGVITAPALFVLQGKDGEKLSQLIKTKEVTKPQGLEAALNIIRENGGIELTVDLANQYATKAKLALSVLPNSQYVDSLTAIVDWLLTRTR